MAKKMSKERMEKIQKTLAKLGQGKTQRQVAEEENIALNTLLGWRKKYGLKKPSDTTQVIQEQEDDIKETPVPQEPECAFILNGDYLARLETENQKLTDENEKMKSFIIDKIVFQKTCSTCH